MHGWVVAVAVLVCACGNGGVPDGAGGQGGDDGTRRERLCRNLCSPLAGCGFLPEEGVLACVELCATDTTQTDEVLARCVSCVGREGCEGVLGACLTVCSPASVELTVTLENGAAGELFVQVFDAITGAPLAGGSTLVGEDGSTIVSLGPVLSEGRPYRVDAFLDADLDGACEVGEQTWRIEREEVPGPQRIELSASAPRPEVCESFAAIDRDLRVLGSGFAPATTVHVVVRSTRLGQPLSSQSGSLTDANGSFSATFPRILFPEGTFTVGWVADLDEDGRCASDDLGGTLEVNGPFTRHVDLALPAEAGGAPDCSLFFGLGDDLTLRGEGFSAYEGAFATFVLVDAAGETVSFGGSIVELGGFTVGLPRVLARGATYRVSLYVDADDNGLCGGPDPRFWVAVPRGEGAREVTVAYREPNDAGACEPHPSL